ncbi:MAG: sugar phosphate isomerase/epimerase [Spirulina sp. SIO3F2]|nr:sugar phosphate isomerase/epimerase [Spirulina sp. SIO3F2]
MQGRLSPLIDGKIQCFPWPYWQQEFSIAQEIGFSLMEWTLDQERWEENPLLTVSGQAEIKALSVSHNVQVGSLTGDCFMQVPFYKTQGIQQQALLDQIHTILDACAQLSINFIVLPLVDNGSLTSAKEQETLIEHLLPFSSRLVDANQKIIFESDFSPERLLQLIQEFPPESFGINYDVGNSAALGFNANHEISSYGHRIDNVHIKDRVKGGGTVPLGQGDADFLLVFDTLKTVGYQGHYILQTARASEGEHESVLCQYRDFVKHYCATT